MIFLLRSLLGPEMRSGTLEQDRNTRFPRPSVAGLRPPIFPINQRTHEPPGANSMRSWAIAPAIVIRFTANVRSMHIRARIDSGHFYLGELNREQRLAVEHGVGPAAETASAPLLVIAGAGSGKTDTVAHRVAHLIVNGADA